MKLIRIETLEAPESCKRFDIVAEHGGKEYRKPVFYKDWHIRQPDDVKRTFAKAVRELDRDIAFVEHGEEYRKHCRFTSNFWGPITDDEHTEQRAFLEPLIHFVERIS